MRKLARISLVTSLLLLLAVVLGMAPIASAATTTVHIFNFEFGTTPNVPDTDPVISLGDTIHWVWDSGFHSTTSVAGLSESWNSGDHSPAFSFDHTFTNAGIFPYYCDIHGSDNGDGTADGMSGLITVSVPEPATLSLLLCGGTLLLVLAMKRITNGVRAR
jgi:plastocyanin